MASTTFCSSCGAEYLAGVEMCADCGIPLNPEPPLPVGEEEGEVVFDLSEWSNEDRGQLERLLVGERITHRWEVGSDLVVREEDADAVERVLDEVEASGEAAPLAAISDDVDDGGDEANYTVMSDIFVAADRLQKDPSDSAAAGDFFIAADAVAITPAPFGIDRLEWQQVQELAASVASALETDVDDDVIAADASMLRKLLSRYV